MTVFKVTWKVGSDEARLVIEAKNPTLARKKARDQVFATYPYIQRSQIKIASVMDEKGEFR